MKKFLVIAMVLFVGLLAFGADKVVQVKGDVTTATAGQVTVDPIKAYTAKIEADRKRTDDFGVMNLAWSLNNCAYEIIKAYKVDKTGDLNKAKAYLLEAQTLSDPKIDDECKRCIQSNLDFCNNYLPKETVTVTTTTVTKTTKK